MEDFTINLNKSEIIDALKRKMQPSPERDMIVEAVISMLDEQNKLGKLAIALLGIRPAGAFSVNEEVIFEKSTVSTYKFHIEKMESKGLIFGGKMRGVVIKINHWANSPYKISYQYIHKDHPDEVRTETADVSDWGIQAAEEFPENLLDDL